MIPHLFDEKPLLLFSKGKVLLAKDTDPKQRLSIPSGLDILNSGLKKYSHELKFVNELVTANGQAHFCAKISPMPEFAAPLVWFGLREVARSPHFPEGVYSAIAGFVEVGESVEQATKREVKEEVGIHIHNLQYRLSQSWPFPDSLMLGFTADYLSGDISVDGVEIEDARWFDQDDLPKLPLQISIARALIQMALSEPT